MQGEQVKMYDMTEERKARFQKLANQIIDVLKNECKEPAEAYCVIEIIRHCLEETYGFLRTVEFTKEQEGHA